MTNKNTLFFELIQVAIGTRICLSHTPSADEWGELYMMAKKQSLVGVCFAGVQRLQQQRQEAPEMTYLTWMGMAAKIQQRNEVMNKFTDLTIEHFSSMGIACSILKGQTMANLYGNLVDLRQSGDVDAWVNISRKELFDLSMKKFGRVEGYNGFHIHYPLFVDCEIEAHFRPSGISSPKRNAVLTKFFEIYKPNVVDASYSPSLAFNRVYIMLHNYKHLCGHGVGLRQMMDYYFVLAQGFNAEEKEVSMRWIECLGMGNFAHASMWVLKEVFGLYDKFMICEADEKLGRFLLNEIMLTGNMGHGDERVTKGAFNSAVGRYLYNLRRSFYLMKIAPYEAMWKPLVNVWGYIKKNLIMFVE